MSRLRAGRSWVRIPVRVINCPFQQSVQTRSGTHEASSLMSTSILEWSVCTSLKQLYSSSSSCSWRVRHVSLFLDPQDEVGPSISSSVVLCFFVLLVYILVLVLVVCLRPSSVRVVATYPGNVLFPVLCSVLLFFCLIHWFFSLSSFVIPSKCLKNFICAASKQQLYLYREFTT